MMKLQGLVFFRFVKAKRRGGEAGDTTGVQKVNFGLIFDKLYQFWCWLTAVRLGIRLSTYGCP